MLVTGSGLLGLVGCYGENTPTVATAVAPAPTLSALALSGGQLNPTFSSATTSYSTMFIGSNSLTVTPTAASGTITVNGTTVPSGTASGSLSLPSGNSTITVAVTGPGGTTTYTITVHQLAQEAYGKASNTGADDEFGYSVALSGDTLAVGAIYEDSNATGINGDHTNNSADASGAVYVFTRSNGVWTQQAYVKASNTGGGESINFGFMMGSIMMPGDNFGRSVALADDTLAVGASNEDSNATGVGGDQTNNSAGNSGAVYVLR